MLEEKLLEGINKKQQIAWKELYNHYYPSLCSYSTSIIKDSEAAQDIVQSLFIKIWESSFNFSQIAALTTYMYRTVYNRSLNYLRDNKSYQSQYIDQIELLSDNEDIFIAEAVEEETITKFYQALSALPDQQKEIILLSLKGNKIQEIANRLKVSANSVKTQKKRAYLFIRKNINSNLAILLSIFLMDF